MRRRTIIAAAFGLLPACSLLTNLDGFSSPDGGIPGAADGPSASPDATTDAATTRDTSPEGSPAFLCTRPHTLCEDFDGVDPLAPWKATVDARGTLSLATDRAASLPSSLHATLPRRPSEQTDRYAVLTRDWPRPWTRVVVEMDMFLEPPTWQDGDINVALATIELVSDGVTRSAFLILNEKVVEVGSSALGYAHGPAFPTGRWTHVMMDFDPNRAVSGAFDGKAFENAITALPAKASPLIRVEIGLSGYNTPAPAVSVYYDNVTVDFIE